MIKGTYLTLLMLTILGQKTFAGPIAISIKDPLWNREYSLKLDLPEDFVIEKTTSDDTNFRLYQVSKTGKVFLAIYIGDHPNFPLEHVAGSEIAELSIGLEYAQPQKEFSDKAIEQESQIRILSEWSAGRLVHREVLVRIYSFDGEWPKFVHAVTSSRLSEAEVEVADRILLGLTVVNEERENSSERPAK